MPKNWSKGFTKENNLSVRKISDTMKSRKIDNFRIWRDKMKSEGKIKSKYMVLKKNGDLAELIGVSLGDGHICVYPRTEELRIISNSNAPGFIGRCEKLILKVFNKKAYVVKDKNQNSTKIGIYEKYISKRIDIPSGARGKLKIKVPGWILKKKAYILRYLRGLYEAEGSLSFHKNTYTHKFIFTNRNESLLNNVYRLVKKLGFNPHKSLYKVQVSRKEEVSKLVKIMKFREYN